MTNTEDWDKDIIPELKLSYAEYLSFCTAFSNGAHPHERYGQAFINKYLRAPWIPENTMVRFPKLFHTTSVYEAIGLISEHFIDWTK